MSYNIKLSFLYDMKLLCSGRQQKSFTSDNMKVSCCITLNFYGNSGTSKFPVTSHKFFYSAPHKIIIFLKCVVVFFCCFNRPVSAYALFFRDTQAAIKGQNPNASFGDVSKIVASMWDALDAEHKNVSIIFIIIIEL
jgi:hypothetical protein